MIIREFKKYCEGESVNISEQLTTLRRALKNIPSKEHIELLPSEIDSLKIRYRQSEKLTIKQRIIGISDDDLKRFKRKKEKEIITIEIDRLTKAQSELKQITRLSSKENLSELTSEHKYILLSILDYSIQKERPVHETLDLLIEIFKTKKIGEKNLTLSIERDLNFYFDENGLIEPENTKTVIFLIRKLFYELSSFLTDEHERLIEKIIEEIKKRGNKDFERERGSLLKQREAINRLKDYIENDQIIKITNTIEEFINLLDIAKISEDKKIIYINEMQKLIELNEEENTRFLVSKYLTQNEYNNFIDAKNISKEMTDIERKNPIDRLIKDVVSLCKYLNIGVSPIEENDIKELLFTKIHLLSSYIKLIKEPSEETSSFRYALYSEAVPNIMRNLEMTDPMEYPKIYSKLIELYYQKDDKPFTKQSEIELYLKESDSISIIYTIIKNKKVLIGITHSKDLDNIANEIPENVLEYLINMQKQEHEYNPLLEQNYEYLLIKLLDLNNIIKSKTLKK